MVSEFAKNPFFPQIKCYLFASGILATRRQEVLNFLDTLPEVVNWRATHLIILVATTVTKEVLSAKIRAKFPGTHFILADVNKNSTQGWSDPITWEFINNPKRH